jgi:1,4-alpha-glucan branching enzyme
VGTGLELHRSVFGESRGFWLPECGYQPGLERALGDLGIRYFFLESHGVLQALPRPPYGTFAPILCPNGVAAFGRDQESSRQVWSSKEGYPGHPDYREFYRDAGFDLTEERLAPFVRPSGVRRFTGLKLHRVTGPGDHKEPYDPPRAQARAREHAGDFLSSRRRQLAEAARWMDRPPHLSCLYDAELFGHWWFEGPDFLHQLFKLGHEEGGLSFVTPSEVLDLHPATHRTQPVFSSWGVGGYSEFWLNEKNDWIYPPMHRASRELSEALEKIRAPKGPVKRALEQAARELLLAQSSDWAFMMRTGSHKAYAEARFKIHLNRFDRLLSLARSGKVEEKFLSEVEERDNLFPDIDLKPFRKGG